MSQSTTSPARLLELLSRQHGLCDRLVHLTEQQRPLVSGGDADRLLALLGERQKLILEMEQVARELRPMQADWRNVRAALPADEGAKADELVAGIERLFAKVMEADDQATRLLSARRGQTAQAISDVRASRAAGAAYAASAGSAAGPGNEWT